MNKKGQIYILAAIILSIAIFVLAKRINIIQQESLKDSFEELSKNYERESIRFINSLLLSNQEESIQNEFLNFTFLFTSYSKTKNSDFELIYIFDYNNKVQVGNFLSQSIFVENESDYVEITGCFDKIPAIIQFQGLSFTSNIIDNDIRKCAKTFDSKGKIWIRIGIYWYPISITKNKPQIVIVSQLEAQEQRKVFIGGEGEAYIKEDPKKPKKLSDLCLEVGIDSQFYDLYCNAVDGKFIVKDCKKIGDMETCYLEGCEWKNDQCCKYGSG